MNTVFQKLRSRSSLAIGFGLATLLLNALAHQHPAFVERWYSRGLFLWIRELIDHSTALLPIPGFYLFWIGVLLFWIWMIRRRPALQSLKAKLLYWFTRATGFASLVLGVFFWIWGFNYARVPFEKQLGLELQPVDSSVLWSELDRETRVLAALRTTLVGADSMAINDQRFWPNHTEDTVRAAVKKWLLSQGFPVPGRVRGRIIYPEGLLFKFGAAGIYWPFVGEGNIEAGLHPLRKLPSMAHEMSHGLGFCDEGVCNFIAYIACAEHPNTYVAYSARLDYWSTLARACWQSDRQRFVQDFVPKIPPGVMADEDAIRLQNSKFEEFAPQLRYQVYDSYLKAQGIGSGMLNYDEVLMLVHAWRKKAE